MNWAILAPGIIAESMAKAMNGAGKDVTLYAVASRNLERACDFAKKWGFKKAYGSYEELLKDPEVEAVYVANPHAFHFDSVMQCLNAGKHVLSEKPAGCNLKQLETMINTAKQKGLFFMEAMWTAFNPCVNKQLEWIAEGKIGQVKHVQSYFCNRIPFDPKNRLWAPELAGGALLDLGIYNIYYAMMISGYSKIKEHSSIVRMENNIDAWNSVNLVFENGITTSFQSACDMPAGSNSHDAIVYGTKGFITSRNFFMSQEAEIHLYKSEWGNDNEVVEVIKEPFMVNGYEYELLAATKCIQEGKLECETHSHQRSIELCKIMDQLRTDWNFKYPFE